MLFLCGWITFTHLFCPCSLQVSICSWNSFGTSAMFSTHMRITVPVLIPCTCPIAFSNAYQNNCESAALTFHKGDHILHWNLYYTLFFFFFCQADQKIVLLCTNYTALLFIQKYIMKIKKFHEGCELKRQYWFSVFDRWTDTIFEDLNTFPWHFSPTYPQVPFLLFWWVGRRGRPQEKVQN